MQLSEITKSGKIVYRVYAGIIDGKKRYRQFKTKGDANKFIRNEKIRKANHGSMAAKVSPGEIADYLELSKKLKVHNTSLREAVEFYLSHIEKTTNPTFLPQAIAGYLADIKPSLAPETVSDYRKRLNLFLVGREEMLVSDVPDGVRSYLDALLSNYTRQTVDNSRRVLSAFFSWASDRHMVGENPCKKIKTYLSKKKGKADVLSVKDVEALLIQIQEDFDVEVATFVIVSLFGGVRPKEFRKRITKNGKQLTVFLDWESIDRKNGEVAISEDLSKTNLYRTVQNETLQAWLQWIEKRSALPLSSETLNYRFRYTWADWRKKNVPKIKFSPDILRHTFGTYRLKALASAGAVAMEMGNSESIVKRHYLDAKKPLSEAETFWALRPTT